MAYTFDSIFAVDPNNPANIAKNATITIFDPADPAQSPIAITDPTGSPLPNPITVDAAGMGPAYQHPTLARVGWKGAGFTGYFTSYEGMFNETVAAKNAAQLAVSQVASTASAALATVDTALAGAVSDAEAAAASAANAASLVGAPADTAIAAAVNGNGEAKAALSANFASKSFEASVTGKLAAAPVRSTSLGGGRLWAFVGDSITDGSSSTNTSVDSYRVLTRQIVGSSKVSPSSINAGVPGNNSTQLLARVDSIIAQGPESVFLLIGTNDAEQLVPIATFQANVAAIAAKFRAAGIPVGMGTVPPRISTAAAAKHTLISQYNLWLRLWAPRNGIKLAAVHTALVDPLTGYAAATLMHADGIHPNDAGHLAIAKAVAVVVDEMVITEPWPVNGPQPGVGMLTNPLMAGTTTATGWAINPGIGSGPAGVAGVAAPVAGDGLPAGQWATLTMDGTAAGGTRYLLAPATGFAAGDRLLICAYVKSSDPNASGLHLSLLNSSTGASVAFITGTFKTNKPGPVMIGFTMPDPAPPAASLRFGIGQAVTTGQNITAYIGAAQIYNLTTGGMATLA